MPTDGLATERSILAVAPDRGGRVIFIGDIHGCIRELLDLLDRIGPTGEDTVISLGDLTRKGPDPVGCVELWMDRGWLAVRGNQDERLLRSAGFPRRFLLPPEDRQVVVRADLVRWIEALPLVIDVPQAGAAAVHGGVLPGTVFDASLRPNDHATLLTLRRVRRSGDRWTAIPKRDQTDDDPFWADLWDGERFVFYGHTPHDAPVRHAHAMGLDTGCVYGGSLTAAIMSGGDIETVSVPARRTYARRILAGTDPSG